MSPAGPPGLPPLLLEPAGAEPASGEPRPGTAHLRDVFGAAELAEAATHEVLRLHEDAAVAAVMERGGELPRVLLGPRVDPASVPEELLARAGVEVSTRAELLRALATAAPLLVGRGQDVPGVASELTSFVLFQLLARHADRPYYLSGPLGPLLLRAYRAEGVAGVLVPAGGRRRPPGAMPYRVALGGGHAVRLHRDLTPEQARSDAAAVAAGPADFLRETHGAGLWEPWAEDLGAGEARAWVDRLRALWDQTPAAPPGPNLFGEDTPYTRRWGTRLGLVQGPMSRVSITPKVARAVGEAGAFPYLALAGMDLDEVDAASAACREAGTAYGVGIVAIGTPPAEFEALVKVLETRRPDRVLIAAPQVDQVDRLQRSGLPLFVHAPVLPVYRSLRELGVDAFVLEGEEAGGHVSTVGALALWQDVLEAVAAEPDPGAVTLVFAGGVASAEGAQLISSLVHFAGLSERTPVALQAGTAYLTTDEFVSLGALSEVYRQAVLAGSDTLVTGESLRLRVRQVATPAIEGLRGLEREVFTSDQDHEAKKRAIEASYLGSLGRAVRGDPGSAGPASYMAGAATAVLETPRTLAELHHELTGGRRRRVEAAGHDAIAILGIGCVMPGSPDVPSFFRDALRLRCFVRDVPPSRWERDLFLCEDRDEPLTSYSGIAGLVGDPDFDSGAFRIPPGVARTMDRSQKIALLAARDALQDAGYLQRPFDRDRVAVILGNSMGGDAADMSAGAVHLRRFRARLEEVAAKEGLGEEAARLLEAYAARFGEGEIDEDTLPGELSNVIAGRVAWAFDLHGENYTVDAACASTLAAVSAAVEALRRGRAEMVLTGGVDTQTDAGTFVKFSKLTALSARGSFPFEARGDGFVVGEGGAVFLLKRYADALRDGDPVYGLIRGWGSSSDGAGQGITAPRSDTQVLAMRRALRDAGAEPAELAYVECHGTGTSLGDATEVASLRSLRGPGAPPLPIGSAKAMVGHLKAGAGAAGLLRATLAVHTRTAPPQVNFEEPRVELELAAAGLRVPTRPEPLDEPGLVGLSSFGFGGTNFHMVLAPAPAGARPPVVEAARFRHPDPGPLDGDTAWLFPGQGSQVVGMIQELQDAPLALPLIERADATFRELRDEPLSPFLWPAEGCDRDQAQVALTDTAVAQPAIFLASAILLAHLEEQGLAPAMAIGHSLGEYGALYAAGVLRFEDALRTVSLRGLSMKERGGDDAGTMAFLNCGPEAAGAVCAATPGYVVVANLNAYDQTVVAGDTAAVHEAVKQAMDAGIRARSLNVSAAFHSRLVADSAADMARHLETVELRYPRVPIPANLSRRLYPRGEPGAPMNAAHRAETIELLKRQLAEPVDFVGQVELAYAAGIRRFVEVGPSDVLAKLVRGILQGKPFASLPLDGRRLDPREQLAGLGAALEAPLKIERRPVRAAPAVRSVRKPATATDTAEAASTEEAVRRVVGEVTGYEPGDIPADADLERDLGIDTLKIFEIFSRLRRRVLPADTPNFRELTTVARIVEAAEAGAARATAQGEGALQRYRLVEQSADAPPAPPARPWEVVAGPGGDRAADELAGCLATGDSAGLAVALGRPRLADIPAKVLPFLRDTLTAVDPARPVRLVISGPPSAGGARVRASLASFARAAIKDLRHQDLGLVDLGASPGADAEEWLARPGPEVRRGATGRSEGDRLEPLRTAALPLAEQLGPDDLVVISGGARGIAAACAQELLETTRARLLLLGRKPEVEEWIVAAGHDRAEYLALDVTDARAVAAADLASRRPTVLVHAAGLEVSRGLATKPDAEIAATWAVKVQGAAYLREACAGPALRAVVHFSSVAALFGNHGQTDYAAANAALHPGAEGPPTLAIAWGPWRDVGMATRGPGAEAMEASGVRFLTPAEGRAAFRDLLAGLLAEPATQAGTAAVFGALGPGFVLPGEPRQPAATQREEARREEVSYRFDLEASPYLADHRLNSRYYLPAVSLIRQLLKRSAQAGPLPGAVLEDVRFLAPVVFRPGEVHDFAVEVTGDDYLFEVTHGGHSALTAQLRYRSEAPDEAGLAALLRRLARALDREHAPAEAAAQPTTAGEEIYRTYFHGPQFRVLDGMTRFVGDALVAPVRLEASTLSGNPLAEFDRVPYLLEALFHAAGLVTLVDVDCPWFYIPAGMRRARVFAARCREATTAEVRVQLRDAGATKHFDAAIVDQDGRVMLAVEGLQMARSTEAVGHPTAILRRGAPLELGGADVLLLDLEAASTWVEGRIEEVLTQAERAEVQAAPTPRRAAEKRAGKLAAKCLARELLARKAHRRYELADLEVLSDGSGPPRLRAPGAPALESLVRSIHLSISHSAGRVVAAAASRPVGVDLEEVRELDADARATVQTAAEASVQAELLEGHGERRGLYERVLPLASFTQKEAVLKASGEGLQGGFGEVLVEGPRLSTPLTARHRERPYDLLTVHDERYVLSVAVEGAS